MFVISDNGELVNLALAERVAVTRATIGDDTCRVAVMFHQNAPNSCIALCTCVDGKHGREIIRRIADAMKRGVAVYDIQDAMASGGGDA